MTSLDQGTIDYKSEVLRKGIHLVSLSIPLIYYFITRELALSILIPMTIISLVIDIGRYLHPTMGGVFYKFFGFMLRKHEMDQEKKNLNGATYVLIAAVLTILIFPKVIVLTSFACLILGDLSAALIGRKFGRHKITKNKTWEGTLAELAINLFIGIIVFLIYQDLPFSTGQAWIVISLMALTATWVESSVSNLDDNLLIPVFSGFVGQITILILKLLS